MLALAFDDSAIMTVQDPILVVPIIPSNLSSFQPVWYLVVAGSVFLAYQLILALWNISPFHPLSHIPGPKLAAATYIPEFYYDAVLFGRYTRRIQELHEIYGPIVRISPNEVHCNDTRFIDEIYAFGNRKRDKPAHQVRGSGSVAHAIFSTTDHDIHRMRRGALAKFFARSQVSKLEPKIQTLVHRLCDKILRAGEKAPFDITSAYSCFSTDVITDYCFGDSFGFLTQESWEPNFRGPLYALLKPIFLFRFFPFLRYVGLAASVFTKHMSDDMALLIKTLTVDMPNQIVKTKNDLDAGITGKQQTVFGSLLESDLPIEEKSVERLTDEATALLSAATETISWTMTVISYHLLTKPELLKKLTDEVNQAVASSGQLPQWSSLEKLPYMGAVIFEGLRLAYGVGSRTARIAPDEDLVYHGEWTPKGSKKPVTVDYVIPRGFPIGMSSYVTHHDERIYPDSHSFIPERWLDEKMQRRKDLERSMISFSKGSRSCLGMNLAFCELYLSLAAMTVRVYPRMKLYETTEEDVAYDHDMFNPIPKASSKGVRAIIV